MPPARLFDDLYDGVIVTTLDGLISNWNPGAERMFGWTRDEVLGKKPSIVHHGDESGSLTRMITSAVVRDGRWAGEIVFVRKDGTIGVSETITAPLHDDRGATVATIGIYRDVTTRQMAEQRLAEERLLLRTLIDAVPDPIFCKDRQGRYLLHNRADQKLFGSEGVDFIGKTVFDHPALRQDAALYHAGDMRVMETGEPQINHEEPFVRPDGSPGWFLTSKFPLRNANGDVIGVVGIARDITLRKHAEEQLGKEQRLLQTLIDAIPDPIFFKDRQGRHLAVNRADEDFFGINREQCLGKSVFDWPIPTELAQRYAADDEAVMESGEPIVNREERYETRDGRKGWLLTSKYPLRDANGEVYGLVGIAHDITTRKHTTLELEEARRRLVDHVENSPLGVLEWTPDQCVRRWAGQMTGLFGWTEEEVLRKHFAELPIIHPEELARVSEVAARLADGRDARNVLHCRNLTRDRGVIHCVWHNSALRDGDGHLVSMLSLVQDVTERVRAEEVIREGERLYHVLIGATNTGYVQTDAEGRVIECNDDYLRLTGRASMDEVVGRPVTEWTAPHDIERNAREIANCVSSGFTRNLELDYLTSDGRIIPLEINARVRTTASGLRVLAFCRDISARRAAEAQRRSFERKLQEKQKLESLGVLAGGIAHDFNNLLTAILGNASLASMDAGEGSPLQPLLGQIEKAGTRAAELCRQMLAYSGRGRFVVQPIDLNSIVQGTNLLQGSFSKKAVMHFQLAPELPSVLADPAQMRQVVLNLVTNASEAIGDRGGSIVVSTGVRHADAAYLATTQLAPELPEGDYVFLDVRDTGAGMSHEVQARIFDPFFSTKFAGRGLGLAAVLGIVRGHDGAIKVESELGKGTLIRVLLPRAEGVSNLAEEARHSADGWRGSGTILLVDDEETVRATVSRMLELFGFSVLIAEDGDVAVEMFRAQGRDIVLVLLDLTMPRLNGEEALQQIRAMDPSARVLLMSGFDEDEVLSRLNGDRAVPFLQKPFQPSGLRDKLQGMLTPKLRAAGL